MKRMTVLKSLLLTMGIAVMMCSNVMADETETETAVQEELTEYKVDGVGVFYLPEGFEVESGKSEEGLPMTYAVLTKDDIEITASRFGTDAYEAAGLELPKDLEEYSQREGTRKVLPEGQDFEEDEFGNLGVILTYEAETEEEIEEPLTLTMYQVLKKGAESYGAVSLVCPEEMFKEVEKEAGLWLSLVELE